MLKANMDVDRLFVDETTRKVRDEQFSDITKMVFRLRNGNKFKVFAAYPYMSERFVFQVANSLDVLNIEDIDKMPWVAGRTARRHWKSLTEEIPQKDLN